MFFARFRMARCQNQECDGTCLLPRENVARPWWPITFSMYACSNSGTVGLLLQYCPAGLDVAHAIYRVLGISGRGLQVFLVDFITGVTSKHQSIKQTESMIPKEPLIWL